jgi:hypothetical protein
MEKGLGEGEGGMSTRTQNDIRSGSGRGFIEKSIDEVRKSADELGRFFLNAYATMQIEMHKLVHDVQKSIFIMHRFFFDVHKFKRSFAR